MVRDNRQSRGNDSKISCKLSADRKSRILDYVGQDGHKYRIGYMLGDEQRVIDHVESLAEQDEYNLDFLNAAKLAFAVTVGALRDAGWKPRREGEVTDN